MPTKQQISDINASHERRFCRFSQLVDNALMNAKRLDKLSGTDYQYEKTKMIIEDNCGAFCESDALEVEAFGIAAGPTPPVTESGEALFHK